MLESIAMLAVLLLVAGLPVIAVFVFFEIMAKRESGEWKDTLQKLAVLLAWVLIGTLCVVMVYSAYTSDSHRPDRVWGFVLLCLKFLASI